MLLQAFDIRTSFIQMMYSAKTALTLIKISESSQDNRSKSSLI